MIGAIMGIWEMVSSISKINNGSEMAAEFRKAADEVQTRVNNIIQLDEELRKRNVFRRQMAVTAAAAASGKVTFFQAVFPC